MVRRDIASAATTAGEPGDQQSAFFERDPTVVFDRLASNGMSPNGILRGVESVLDLAAYYEMKHRAATVGTLGFAPILARTRTEYPAVRVHLVGHSFGGLVLTSALAGRGIAPVASMTLLQAAFTQYGFARKWDGVHDGLFRSVVTEGGRRSVGGDLLGPRHRPALCLRAGLAACRTDQFGGNGSGRPP
jgi:pimeloyl-ACP methyl ester carboxylesterase